MRAQAGEAEIARVCERIKELGLEPHIIPGAQRTAIGITGNQGPLDAAEFEDLPGVAEAIPVSKPYKLVSREVKPEDTVVRVGEAAVGGPELVFCAGPCSVESREQILATARAVKAAGAKLLRGGAYKPRTSPYAFQGLAEEGLHQLVVRVVRGDGQFADAPAATVLAMPPPPPASSVSALGYDPATSTLVLQIQ
jgi:3-deoxy-7-phosphoheptulonate synthase